MNKEAIDLSEELEILKAMEAGTLVPASNAAEHLEIHRAAAEATLKLERRQVN